MVMDPLEKMIETKQTNKNNSQSTTDKLFSPVKYSDVCKFVVSSENQYLGMKVRSPGLLPLLTSVMSCVMETPSCIN